MIPDLSSVGGVAAREHRLGIAGMVACTVLWSIAGIVARYTSVANGFESTFWRSAFCAVCVGGYLLWRDGGAAAANIRSIGWPGVVSSLMWAAMFTCFMLALTRSTVANVLVMSSLQPFCVALAGWVVLGERVLLRTWIAMTVAFAGVVIMFADLLGGGAISGAVLALGVPIAAAVNVVTLKRTGHRIDFASPVMIGGILSALFVFPLAWPLQASPHDIALLAVLGAFQLALPCVFLAVWVVRRLSAAEVGLLALLEVLLGPIWVWLAFNEAPTPLALIGGAIVLGALVVNAVVGLRAELS